MPLFWYAHKLKIKTISMYSTKPEFFQHLVVQFCSVALVPIKMIPGIFFMKFKHQAVPGYLGDYARRSAGKNFFIALYDCFLGNS